LTALIDQGSLLLRYGIKVSENLLQVLCLLSNMSILLFLFL